MKHIKVGDIVIIKRYYDEDKEFFIPLSKLKYENPNAYKYIKNKTPLRVDRISNESAFPFTLKDTNTEYSLLMSEEEIELASIDWKQRLK
jgi:hypothetical protein